MRDDLIAENSMVSMFCRVCRFCRVRFSAPKRNYSRFPGALKHTLRNPTKPYETLQNLTNYKPFGALRILFVGMLSAVYLAIDLFPQRDKRDPFLPGYPFEVLVFDGCFKQFISKPAFLDVNHAKGCF